MFRKCKKGQERAGFYFNVKFEISPVKKVRTQTAWWFKQQSIRLIDFFI